MKPVVTGAVGLVLGVGLGMALRGGPAPVEVVEVPGETRTRTVVEHVESTVEDTECASRLRECESQLRMQETVVEDHEGAWQDWPAEVAVELEPDVFEERAAAFTLGELNNVDCAEFPCVATFAIDPDTVPFSSENPSIPLDHLNEMGQIMGEQMGIDGEVLVYPVQVHGDEVETVLTFAVMPSGYESEALRVRMHYRLKSEAETALCINGACD
ncbi:MAG: hypothetical protein GY913_07360 [Proteobacteria bacterium]|nr:hypothetical protein [Pseudomonadota bacterium]MCP4916727.1 hypothetical protein [Pseudomonadota bacterium]